MLRPPHIHTIEKNYDLHLQSIAPSINYLITRIPLPKVDWSALLKLVSKAFQMSCEYLDVHWMLPVGLYRLTINSITTWLVDHSTIGSIFCDILSVMGHILSQFTLKIAELHCNMPLCDSYHPFISGYGVDKNCINGKKFSESASCIFWSGYCMGSLINFE